MLYGATLEKELTLGSVCIKTLNTSVVTYCVCHAGGRHAIAAVLEDPPWNSEKEVHKREGSIWS